MSITLIIIVFLTPKLVFGFQEIFSRSVDSCHLYRDVIQDYRISVYEFTTQVYRVIAPYSSNHFVFSPLSVWMVLAAIAEGAEPNSQKHLFRLLKLPDDPCSRLKYYQLARTRYLPGNDVNIVSSRTLVVDQGLVINPDWNEFVSRVQLIDLASAPIRYDPQGTIDDLRQISSASLDNLDLSGNSIILDATNFNGLWSEAFSNAVIQRSPFYNHLGQQIGSVDLMRVKTRAKMAYISSLNVKILELPIGYNGRYRMLFGLTLDAKDVGYIPQIIKSTIVIEFLRNARESYVPIEIAIPRFTMTSEVDVKKILEDLEETALWTDPTATRYISNPAALPSGFVQRFTITLDKYGVRPAPNFREASCNETTGLDPAVGRDFIANRPFIFGLFDSETYSCLMASIYSQPAYM